MGENLLIRGTHGFGLCDAPGAALGFDIVAGTWDGITPGPPGPSLAGPGLSAFKWFGTGNFTRLFDRQTSWVIGFDLQQAYGLGSGTLPAQNQFLQLSDASGVILSLELQLDGTISVKKGGTGATGSGTQVGRTLATFAVNVWSGYLEFAVSGLGGSTSFQLWQNDISILSGTCTTSLTPDRITFRSDQVGRVYAGLRFANIVILDAQGPAPWNARLGPIRLTTLYPIADASGSWNGTVNGSPSAPPLYVNVTDYPGVDAHGSPDGDYSYLAPNLLNAPMFFQMSSSPCYGLVLGVMANHCYRGASGSTTCDAMLLQQATQYNLGTSTVNGGYHTSQQFIGTSFLTGLSWVDSEINGALWGARSGSPGLQLTQMYLEKIVSLRAVPFKCGQQSYSF